MTTDQPEGDAPPAPGAAEIEERRDYLFDMLTQLATLAERRGERAMAVMLAAIVAAYR